MLSVARETRCLVRGQKSRTRMNSLGSRDRTLLRPLLIAEQCNPEQFSVPLVGWSQVQALFRRKDLQPHLITQVRNRDAIVRAGLREGDDFTAIDTERLSKNLYRVAGLLGSGKGKGWTTLAALKSLSDSAFERKALAQFGDRLKRAEFDLVHRITPLSPTRPCRFAAFLKKNAPDCPLVLGPLNGGLPWPPGFNDARHAEREWLSYVRGASRWLPGRRSTLQNTRAFMIGSRATWAQIPPEVRERCTYVPENAVDPARFPGLGEPVDAGSEPDGDRPLRLVFLGRLVPYKCCDLALSAAAGLLRAGKARFEVVGDGPERAKLEALAKELGVDDAVDFRGWVPHEEVREVLEKNDLLVFPSVREFGGGVVSEAMAAGVVPIVVDYGGPAELCSPTTGWILPLGRRGDIVKKLEEALQDAAVDREGIRKRAQAGKERIRGLLTWDAKATQTRSVYQWALGQQGRPDFASDFGVALPEG